MVGRQSIGDAQDPVGGVRILHVAASYLPATRYGGTIVSVHGLCKGLAARGHDVHVFTTSVDGPRDSDVPLATPVDLDGVKVWYFPSRLLRRLYWSPPLGRALARHMGEFDIAHLHALFVWPVWAAASAARRAGVPYVFSPRGMLEQGLVERRSPVAKRLLIALFGRRTIERASGLHVTSAREAAEAAAFGLALPPVYEVPNGVDLDEGPIAGDDVAPASRPYVLFLGRVSWKKGLDRLIAAMRHVADTTLVVAGPDDEGYWDSLESQAAAAGVADRVVFRGPVHGQAKRALLRRADLLVLPSYSENFGNVVLEAMAAGCPVIVTPEVGSGSVVLATGGGRVVQGDPDSLGRGIADLLADAEARRAMGARGRAAMAADYSWAAVAERMEAVYESVRAGRREGAC